MFALILYLFIVVTARNLYQTNNQHISVWLHFLGPFSSQLSHQTWLHKCPNLTKKMRAKFSSIHWLTTLKFPYATHTSFLTLQRLLLPPSSWSRQSKKTLLNYQLVQEDSSEVSNYLQFAMASWQSFQCSTISLTMYSCYSRTFCQWINYLKNHLQFKVERHLHWL